MDRRQKQELVNTLNGHFKNAQTVIVTQYSGIKVAEITKLRKEAHKEGAVFQVVKNRLAKIALKGTPFNILEANFKGPTAIAFSSDPVAAAKLMVNFSKKNDKLTIIAGAITDKSLTVEEINSLAKLPSLDELRGKLIGVLKAPAQKIAGVLSAPAGQVARVIQAYSDSKQDA